MLHIQLRENHGPIEMDSHFLERRYDMSGSLDGLISTRHVNVHSDLLRVSLGCKYQI